MKKLSLILALICGGSVSTPNQPSNGDHCGTISTCAVVQPMNQGLALSDLAVKAEQDRLEAYERGLEQVAATESMQQLHANYARLGSPFKDMTTVQFADLFHRSRGFTLPGTREVGQNMYLQGWNSEVPALSDPEPDDCTPEEIEAWYRKFYDPWHAKRPEPSLWAHELPFVDPQPQHVVRPGFTVIGGRGYRWGIVLMQNFDGDYVAIGQLKPDFKPESAGRENQVPPLLEGANR
jgi:hypothetical protein